MMSILNLQPHIELEWKMTYTRFNEWISDEVFHPNWWILLILFITAIYLWWKLVDKSRFCEIMIYTVMMTVVIIVLDELGEELTLWDYPVDIFPLFPPISAIDVSCLPIVYSLIYQYFKTWKSFTVATIVMAMIFCFICEPIFVWLGVYQMLHWKSYYGFLIYIAIAFICKLIVIKIYALTYKSYT